MNVKNLLNKAAFLAKKTVLNTKIVVLSTLLGVQMKAYAGALGEVTGHIEAMKEEVRSVCNAVAGILALIGVATIYYKMSNGDQDVKKTAILTIGGAAAFAGLAQAVPAMITA